MYKCKTFFIACVNYKKIYIKKIILYMIITLITLLAYKSCLLPKILLNKQSLFK